MTDVIARDFDVFCHVLRDTVCLFDEMITFENDKLDAVAANDVEALDHRMHEEQAYLMKMKALDAKRETLQEKLGVAGVPLLQITEQYEGDEKESLLTLYDDLSEKSAELKESIATTKKIIDLHITSIAYLLERLEGKHATYNKDGELEDNADPPKRFKSRKA